MDVLILGGGPAGLATARGYREAGGHGRVTLVAGEGHVPYNRPPLTKDFLRGESARGDLPMVPAGWFAEQGVELVHGTASDLDPDRRRVSLADGRELGYDACVLATGSTPMRPPVPGAEDLGLHVMRTIEDSEALRSAAGREGARVVVIGSGFIGCEAAASLAVRGAQVTVLAEDDVPQASRLGPEAGERIAGWLTQAGAELRPGTPVARIERTPGGFRVHVESGGPADAEVVLLATGVRPNGELAGPAGLDRTASGRIGADVHLRTLADGLLVAGDLAAARNAAVHRSLAVEHWGEALNQGEVAGRTLAGDDSASWATAPGFWSTIGDHTLKHVAWGDGFDDARFRAYEAGAFSVHYGLDGVCVGVLTHDRDEDYERGRELVESGAALP